MSQIKPGVFAVLKFFPLVLFALLPFLITPTTQAQAVVIPGTTPVGSSAPSVQVTLTAPAGGTIAAVKVLGQGSSDVDFAGAGGTCVPGLNVLPGTSCSVSVVFSPASPGQRSGAVVLLDGSNHVLASQLLAGEATGSVGVFVPGTINTVAGDANWVYDGDGRSATSSAIFLPFGIAVDGKGNLFLADSSNNRIRRVDAVSGLLSTVAGNGIVGSTGDGGPATSATLNNPTSIALDSAGNLYFSDSGNDAVRRVDAFSGVITTVAGVPGHHGYSGDNGPATAATFNSPNGISFDANGDLYIADTGNHAIRMVNAAGVITTVAGTGAAGFSGDGGPATEAMLNAPWSATPIPSVTPGVNAGFYIADQNNDRVRMVNANGTITTVAGTTAGFSGDTGAATQAQLYEPASVLVDVAGNIYIADSGNNRVRRIAANTGIINTYAGNSNESFSGDGGPANAAGLYGPYAFALDTQGSLYIADVFHNRIRKVAANTAILNYPVIRVNRVSSPQNQTIENDGNAALNLSKLNPVSNSQIDVGTTTCSLSAPLASLAQCVIGVDFAPTTVGTLVIGEADVDSNAGNSPGVISLTGQVLDVDPTVTTVTSSVNPSTTGQQVVFTVTVTSTGQTPTGTITLLDGTTMLGTTKLQSGGVASFLIATLTDGNHSITASYAGDSQNAAGVSPALIQVVKDASAATTTALSSSASPTLGGAPILLTATINVVTANSGNGAITGSVAIKQGPNTLGTTTINNATATSSSGVATIILTDVPVGTDSLVAVYAGNGNYAGSTSAPLIQTVQLATSKTTLTSSGSPAYAGAALQLTATLTSNGGLPTGSVSFFDGTISLGSAPINAQGVASLSVSGTFWTVGSHTLTASYGGDADNGGSSSQPFLQVINIAPTSVSVASSLNPSGLGATVVFAATVSSSGGTPTGSVQFFDGATSLGSGILTSTGTSSATTSFSNAALALGPHSITAKYLGDALDAISVSPILTQTVNTATIGVTLQTSAASITFGSPLTLTAQVSGTGSTPSGTLTLLDSGTLVVSLPVPVNGIVPFVNPSLAIGQHSLTASYSGDTNHAAVASAAINETVQQVTTTALTASASAITAGKTETLIAVVTGVSGKPFTGTVKFTDAGALLAIVTPDASGSASYSVANLTPGQHVILASYSGDTLDAASSSLTSNVTVTIASTSTTLTTNANPINSGSLLTLTSTVSGIGGTPTGTVSFHDGATLLTSMQLTSAGTATFSLSTLTPGVHQLSASYSGDTDDSPSTSPTTSEQIVQQTSVMLTSNENPALLQDNVTITMTISNGSAATPTGSVALTDNGTPLATLQLNAGGTASYVLQSPALGTHTLVVNYAGDSQNSPASSQPLIETVTLRPSTVSFSASSSAISSGQQVTLISVVQAAGSRPATGTVTWVSGTTTLGSAPIDTTGLATINVIPPQGGFSTVAQYSGDSLYASSVSPTVSLVVGPTVEFTISLTPSTMSMSSGSHGTAGIAIASATTFSDTLALGCAGLPIDATCTFSTNQIIMSGGASQSLSVVVDTGNPLGSGASASLQHPDSISTGYACTLPAGVLFALLFGFNRRKLRKLGLLEPKLMLTLLIIMLGAGSSVLTGCASSLNENHTPAGSYTFQIVATGNKTGVTQTAIVHLTVTQ